jgi:hypothetical protein
MTTTTLVIWIVTLVVVALIIVPVALHYLRDALTAARHIERNLSDMLDAGLKIARHTSAVPALDDTIAVAVAMKPVAHNIETKTAAVATLLSSRAAKKGGP